LKRPVVVNSASASGGAWTQLPDGRQIRAAELAADGALGLRAHLESLRLPAGGLVLVYDPAQPQDDPAPFYSTQAAVETEFWSRTVFSSNIVVECQLPRGANPAEVSFSVTGLAYITVLPTAGSLAKVGSCNNDATCYPEWAAEASGVARIAFVDSGISYLCTGCLLSSTNVGDFFLTANHCVPNQRVASTLELYWFYQTRTCDGPPPSLSGVPQTGGGADFLAGASGSDFSLLRLRQPAPTGASHLSWSAQRPTRGEAVVSIHHPGGSYTRISFGSITGSDPDFWDVRWSSGVTEEGSSGAPLFNRNREVIGQLFGGLSSCETPLGIDTFGRFDVSYSRLEGWLGAGGQPVTNRPPVVVPVGTFNGLFVTDSGPAPGTSGAFTLTASTKGRFTVRLQFAGQRASGGGLFSSDGVGRAEARGLQVVVRARSNDSTVMEGTVSDGFWTARLRGDLAPRYGGINPAPQAGRYTMVLPGSSDTNLPAGDGYGTLAVSSSGKVVFSGLLADGTRVAQSATLSSGGRWPFFVPLTQGRGEVFGWLQFEDVAGTPSGTLSWIQTSGSQATVYTSAFEMQTVVKGSKFVPPAASAPVFPASSGGLSFTGAGLSDDYRFVIDTHHRFKALGPEKLSLSLSPKTGRFSGRLKPDAQAASTVFGGVWLQEANEGSGNFLLGGQSGRVLLQAN
jgi:hypothetical protein